METKQRSFEELLSYGDEAEKATQKLFMDMGFFAIPKYLYVSKGAPSLLCNNIQYSVPDIDVSSYGNRFWVETKRKVLRSYYPDTGFSIRLCNHYIKVQEITGSMVFVLFFDEKMGSIYGNWLNNLMQKRQVIFNKKLLIYPLEQSGIIYFPYPDAMINISKINGMNINSDAISKMQQIFRCKA